MNKTRKLQIAADLIEEVADDVSNESLEDEIRKQGREVDSLRSDVFQERVREATTSL